MSALGSLVVKLALDHAEYTKGLDRNSQAALKFAKNTQTNFDKAGRAAKNFFGSVASGAVGAVAGIVGINAAINRVQNSIAILNSLEAASQKTGASVERLSQIEQVTRSFGDNFQQTEQAISKMAKRLAEFDNGSNQAHAALRALNVETVDVEGNLRDTGDIFIDVSKSLREYEDGASKVAVANALFEESGVELIPTLNHIADTVDTFTGVSADAARQAELFSDRSAHLSSSVDTLFMGFSQGLLPSLIDITGAFNDGAGQSTAFAGAGEVVGDIFKGVIIVLTTATEIIKGTILGVGSLSKGLRSLATLDFGGAVDVWEEYSAMVNKSAKEQAEFIKAVLDGDRSLERAATSGGMKKTLEFTLNMPQAQRNATDATNEAKQASDANAHALAFEAEQARIRNEQLSRVEQITRSVATAEEVMAGKIRELNQLLEIEGGISIETYNRALRQIHEEYDALQNKGRETVDATKEFFIQASRDIQVTFSDSLFTFVTDGFDDMVRNAKNTALRIASEFASIRLLQASGIAGALGAGGATALSGGGGGGASAFNIANTGLGAANLINSGFGASPLFGSFATSGVGQSLGLSTLGPVTELTSLGSSLSSGLGVLGAGGVGIGIGSLLAGNKEIAGLNGTITSGAGAATGAAIGSVFPGIGTAIGALAVGIIGGAVNAIFGRGAPKFKQEELVGSVSAGGFEGILNQQFKEKGGLARSSRFSNFIADTDDGVLLNEFGRLSESGNIPGGLRDAVTDSAIERALEVGSFLDEAFGAIDNTLRDTADILGIGTSALDSFNAQIDLISEKGEALTEQQISGAIADISNQMIATLIPSIDELARGGETYANTLTRIGAEFNALENVLVVTGQSVDQAREKIQGLTFAERTGLTDRFGGADALNAQVNSFFNNVLDESQKLDIVEARVLDALKPIGVDFIPTIDQLYEAFASGNPDLVQAALHYDELIIEANRLNESVNGVTGSVQSLTDSLDAARKKAVALGEAERQGIKDRADRAKGAFEFFRNISFTDEQKIAFEADQFANAVSRIDGVDYSSFDALVGSVNDMIASNNGDFLDVIDAMKQFPLFIKSLKESGLDDPIASISKPDAKNLTRNLEAELRDAFSNLERVANAEKNKIANHFQAMFDSIDDSISNTTSKISDLQSISSLLTRTVDEIKGISINEARAQISGAITRARFGGQLDVDKLGASLSVLKNQDSESFATRFDFARSQSRNISLIDSLNSVVGDQLSIEEQALDSLENQRKLIQEQYDFEIETLTSMLDAARTQVEQMLGVDTTLNTLLGAKGNLYNALIAIAKNTDKTAKLLTLAGSFASGGTHAGGLRFVGERGIELEATGPSRIFSNSEVKQMMGGGSVVVDTRRMESLLNNVSDQTRDTAEQTRKTADFLRNVTRDGQSIVTTTA